MSKKLQKELVVFESGGKQYSVTIDTIVSVEKLNVEPGKNVVIEKVLLHHKDGKTTIGDPYLGTTIEAEVLAEEKDKKVRVFKFKKKTGYRKTQGHRQNYSTIKILKIKSKQTSKKVSKETDTSKDKKESTESTKSK